MISSPSRAFEDPHVRQLLPVLAVLVVGCSSPSPAGDPEPTAPEPAPGSAFAPTKTGTIAGHVTWSGPIPQPPGFLYALVRPDGLGLAYHTAKNPNRPRIDAKTHAVAGAVVFLRGVEPAAAKPWDLPPVRVEVGNGRIGVIQGERRGRVGFVKRGDAVAMTSTEPAFHILRGRGDDFFSLTLPEPERPHSRTLTKPGRVELSSGTGQYWARADLFVADHPYFTLTDAQGRFTLKDVPTGAAEVVVWLPGWDSARQERDPDRTAIVRMSYTPPVERSVRLTLDAGQTAERDFTLP